MCIWATRKTNKQLEKVLQQAVDNISEYCSKWGFKINKSKTCHTTFTSAGERKNYSEKYKLNLQIDNEQIPLDPHPTFLGIKLDPKLSYKKHLEEISKRQISKVNLIRKIKSFKWKTSRKINTTLYKSLIQTVFDYCFIILQSENQQIKKSLQIFQNKILRIIKRFPLKTSVNSIHKTLQIDTIDQRANKLFIKFIKTKSNNELIANEIAQYHAASNHNITKRFITPFDKIMSLKNQNLI